MIQFPSNNDPNFQEKSNEIVIVKTLAGSLNDYYGNNKCIRYILARTNINKIIGLTNFYHYHSMHGFCQNFKYVTGFVFYILVILVRVELPLCIVATLS